MKRRRRKRAGLRHLFARTNGIRCQQIWSHLNKQLTGPRQPPRTRLDSAPSEATRASPNDVIGSEISPLVNWRRRRRRRRWAFVSGNETSQCALTSQKADQDLDHRSKAGPNQAKEDAPAMKFSSRRLATKYVARDSRLGVWMSHQLQTIVLVNLTLLLALSCSPRASVLATHIVSDEPNSVIIRSDQGQLFRGLRLTASSSSSSSPRADVVAFLGVRYASAPVKRLRFMPPTPFTYSNKQAPTTSNNNQSQVHDVRQFGPICMQRFPMEPTREQAWPLGPGSSSTSSEAPPNDWRFHRAQLQLGLMERLLAPSLYRSWRPIVRRLASRFVQSEDCLNLNIYTPIEALERRPSQVRRQETETGAESNSTNKNQEPDWPVLVLIHGHSFEFGSGSALDGRRFAQNNRVVVITLNYRLHILGFPPRLATASRGNLGLLDQVAALHWIQANVRSFGGSPNKITLMGSKGGAIFVHLLMLSPLAKGLFQRAVLEDGTALSPVIANNMALSGTSPNQQRQQQQQQVAASQQHLRLLAQLNDCPTGLQQQAGTGNHDEETRASLSSMIECLKAKPAELIMRHLPVELIDTSRPIGSGAGIPLALRWLRPLEQTLDLLIKEELKSQLDDSNNNNSGPYVSMPTGSPERRHQLEQLKRLIAQAHADQSPALVEAHQLDRLIGLMINRFLQSGEPRGTDRRPSSDDEDSGKLIGLLSELLGAIYLPSNKTLPVGPVFAPQLEPGLILAAGLGSQAELDLASSMLQRSSPFNRRDLLIGLTHPLVDYYHKEPSSTSGQLGDDEGQGALTLAPSLASRKLLELGLAEEQAIGQVNLFVRSFYRYHQQEISNSIISQYLSKKSGMRPAAGARYNNSRLEEIQSSSGATLADQQSSARLQKQLFLADAMRALYQDSLVDVPLIKTGLIHSLQQLESVADLFVSKQLSQLEADDKQDGENRAEELEQQLVDEHWLEEEFYKFARGLYQEAHLWPIRLMMPSGRATQNQDLEQRQPRSTYLFQLVDKLDWLQRLRNSVSRIDSRAGSQSQGTSPSSVRAILVKMIEELTTKKDLTTKTTEFRCSFGSTFEADEEEQERTDTLFGAFRKWICKRRLDAKLANFVKTGNVNLESVEGLPNSQNSETLNTRPTLEHQFEMECARQQQGQPIQVKDDHHLVQLSGSNGNGSELDDSISSEPDSRRQQEATPASTKLANSFCKQRLQELAFEELVSSDGDDDGSQVGSSGRDSSGWKWNVFNVFTQQLASLFAPNGNEPSQRHLVIADWSLDSFISSTSADDELREALDGKVTFWANFVTALNCSRTQPIGAGSLSLFSQANSTLLQMNLNQNCQLVGSTRTANSVLQSMGARIKLELGQQVAAWRRPRTRTKPRGQLVANLSSSQNHHSLRMANMSNNQDQQQQHQHQQQQQQTGQLEGGGAELSATGSGSVLAGWLTVDTPNGPRGKLFHRQLPLSFWLLALMVVVVISVLVMGGFVMLRRQWQRRRKRDSKSNDGTGNTSTNNSDEELQQSQLPSDWHSTGLQLDAGGLFDQPPAQVDSTPASGDLADTPQLDRFVECRDASCLQRDSLNQSPRADSRDLNQYGSQTGNGVSATNATAASAAPETELFMNQLDRQAQFIPEERNQGDQQHQNGSTLLNVSTLTRRDNHHHLPTCNLMLMQQQQQQQLLLSSSSETTTTTNTQRARSSVSLISGSTNSKRPPSASKKRVKISDPRRHTSGMDPEASSYGDDGGGPEVGTPLVELAAHQLQLIGSPRHFCPIHRSSSNLNLVQSTNGQQLVIDDATKFQLLSGHHSLLRHYNHNHHHHNNNHQRPALTLNDDYPESAGGGYAMNEQPPQQQQVCAAHNFEQQHQQRQQVIFANGYYQRHGDHMAGSLNG